MADNPYTNKVVFGDETLIDLTNDTVSAESLAEGETAHDASGNTIVGTASVTTKPTVDDSGKVWTAGQDGTASWQQVESSSGILLVRITVNGDESYSADKTYDEILEAYESYKMIYGIDPEGNYIPLGYFDSGSFVFDITWSYENEQRSYTILINSDNTVEYYVRVIGQSDWNQNDDTVSDYIKNRPFYENNEVLFDGDCLSSTTTKCSINLVIGEKYIVSVDGTNYETIAYEEFGSCNKMLSLGSSDGLSFSISIYTYQIVTGSDCHITVSKQYLKQIDSKFIENASMLVTFTDTNDGTNHIESDKTRTEIYNAVQDGRFVYGIYRGDVYVPALTLYKGEPYFINTRLGDNHIVLVRYINPEASSEYFAYGSEEVTTKNYLGNISSLINFGENNFVIDNKLTFESVAYGCGKFVAIGYDTTDKAAYSIDGKTWIKTTLPGSYNWKSVSYHNGRFVTVAYNSNIAAYSTDGIRWTQTSLPTSAEWTTVACGNGKFVALAYRSSVAAYSTDGITWTQVSMPAAANWKAVTYGSGKFVAIAYNSNIAAYSTDCITWIKTSLPGFLYWQSVAYGDSKFVAIAENSKDVAYSINGLTWYTSSNKLPKSGMWQCLTYGNGDFVAVEYSSSVAAYSTDGLTWTQTSLPSYESWHSVVYGGDKFVAVSNLSSYSFNGIDWVGAGDSFTDKKGNIVTSDVKDAISNVVVVNVSNHETDTGLEYYADKTFDELSKAYYSGKIPVLIDEYGNYIPFGYRSGTELAFEKTYSEPVPGNGFYIRAIRYTICSNGAVEFSEQERWPTVYCYVDIYQDEEGNYVLDTPYEDILNNWYSGCSITAYVSKHGFISLSYEDVDEETGEGNFYFNFNDIESNPDGSKLIKSGTYVISSDNTVTYYETDYTNNLLPDSTEDDNNKILSVVGGVPTWKEADSLSITSSDDGAGNVTITIA